MHSVVQDTSTYFNLLSAVTNVGLLIDTSNGSELGLSALVQAKIRHSDIPVGQREIRIRSKTMARPNRQPDSTVLGGQNKL